MALDQAAWYARLKSWVPTWVFEQEDTNVAIFQATAKILAELDASAEDLLSKTFISTATGSYLDLIGYERGVTRLEGEFDAQYAIRIRQKSTISQVSKPSLLAIVNAFLIQGTASIREDWEGSIFCDREEFVNRGSIIIDPITNAFTILVDKQLRPPYSFADREYFSDRENFVGDSESSDYVFDLIVKAVNENKALGTLYRIIERFE